MRKGCETFLELRRVENYSQRGMSTAGILECTLYNGHPCLKHHYWFQEKEADPPLALNNGTCNQPLTFGDVLLTAICGTTF